MKVDLDELKKELEQTKQEILITEAFIRLWEAKSGTVESTPAKAAAPRTPKVKSNGAGPSPVALMEKAIATITCPFTMIEFREHLRQLDPVLAKQGMVNVSIFLKRRIDRGILSHHIAEDGVTKYARNGTP